jgi:hypothetical protein
MVKNRQTIIGHELLFFNVPVGSGRLITLLLIRYTSFSIYMMHHWFWNVLINWDHLNNSSDVETPAALLACLHVRARDKSISMVGSVDNLK